MNRKLKEIIFDMRHQPVIAGVTLIGTALSIFMIIVMVIVQQIAVLPFAPESQRGRLLHGWYMNIADLSGEGESSSGLDYETAERLYGGLEGVERMSVYAKDVEPATVEGPMHNPFSVDLRRTDGEFWNIFNHTLVSGRYYTAEEARDNRHVAVVNESTARQLFGDGGAVGKTFYVDFEEYTVIGVVKDHTRLATHAQSDVFLPASPLDPNLRWGDNPCLGNLATVLLMEDGADPEDIRAQVKTRYDQLNSELKAQGKTAVYHQSPYDQFTAINGNMGSNTDPETESSRNMHIVIYALLLIVPAINLSSMLHSRLRRRVSEIGVRRAFGCTRMRLIADILAENMLVTLVGGVIGVTLGYVFAMNMDSLYLNILPYSNCTHPLGTPDLGMLLNWRTIGVALGVCLVLNVLTASIPAWQATRLSPVEAINGKV